MRFVKSISVAAVLVLAAACAPDNLDITPSPTATNTSAPTNTREPRPTATAIVATPADSAAPESSAEAAATVEATEASAALVQPVLERIIAAVPGRINAGEYQWNRSREAPEIRDVDGGGRSVRLDLTDSGGSLAALTFITFDTPEAAQAQYDTLRGRLRTLESSDQDDNFPTPNAIGVSTSGSDGIFVVGNLFVRINSSQFSSTRSEPIRPLAREVFNTILPAAGVG